MEKIGNALICILSIVGLILGGWLGYQLAGPIGVVVFVPLGALAGLIVGFLNWRLILLLG